MLIVFAMAALTYAHPEDLVDTGWVAAHAADAEVRIVDMRRTGYGEGHVPGAVYLAPDAIRDPKNPPTFLPSPSGFAQMMGRLGISSGTHVVAYDERGGIYAARRWWILRYFGHTRVSLMNGGWIAWTAERRPTLAETPSMPSATFIPRPQPDWVATATDVVAAIGRPSTRILDARTDAEIEGRDRRNIRRGGFVPSSVPVYWEDLLDPERKTFRPAEELQKIFDGAGVQPSQEVIAYCQVGMRASVDLFALHLIGHETLRNYYGAWEEWGNREDLPVATKK